jgi:hypothetical protein
MLFEILELALRTKLILTPDGYSIIATGSGPIGPIIKIKPSFS